MPSPLRKSGGGGECSIAYSRWESVDSDDTARVQVPFTEFEEEGLHLPSPGRSVVHRRVVGPAGINDTGCCGSFGRIGGSNKAWSNAVRVLAVLVAIGVGWILGFLARWAVHHHVVDPLGHCTAPKVYRYDAEKAVFYVDQVNETSISEFLGKFNNAGKTGGHVVGSTESGRFADYITRRWEQMGVDTVETFLAEVNVPKKAKVKRIQVISEDTVVETIELDGRNSGEAAYSASGVAEGRIVYGHLGRTGDFRQLRGSQRSTNFSGNVVLLRVGDDHDVGSMVRNAQAEGAGAVVLFPDPDASSAKSGKVVKALSRSVKFAPGDPFSPYNPTERSMPKIPVVSVSSEVAMNLLNNYTDDAGQPSVNATGPMSFTVRVEVRAETEKMELRNVIGTIRGRFEPTRYVIIGSRHDVWQNDNKDGDGYGHAALMELARVFGKSKRLGLRPGRSVVFASWDGEEFGRLGSTAWLHKHAKELSSRAVAFINLDQALQSQKRPISASPMLRNVVELAAKSVPCHEESGKGDHDEASHNCTLYSEWAKSDKVGSNFRIPPPTLASQSMLGISSVDVDVGSGVRDAGMAVKFAMVVVLRLAASARVPAKASDYAVAIRSDMEQFLYSDGLGKRLPSAASEGIKKALDKFSESAARFHSTYETSFPALEFLAYHEFSDQLLELERAFLLPPSTWDPLLQVDAPNHRHAIYGPSPVDAARAVIFPRLAASIEIEDGTGEMSEAVKKEVFYVVDALESATCVLDNHVIFMHNEAS